MTADRTALDRYLLALILAAALAAAVGGPAAPEPARAIVAVDKASPDLEGSWKGTWEDTVYQVSGAVTMDVTANLLGYDATGTIDLTSINPVWGVRSGTATGTLAGDELTFTFTADMVGNGSGTLNGADGTGSGTVTGFMEFGGFTFAGTVASGSITGTFDFTSPSGGAGNVTLSPAVPAERATMSGVKAAWR